MGLHTGIEWCDSTINPMMGCDGCELWTPAKRTCYAGVQIERYQGNSPNFPAVFTEPKLYTHRLEQMAKWPNLTGTHRKDKPWLNGMPRVVFLCDMGDPFTESLRLDWLAPHLGFLGGLPQINILLTKRPKRMAQFSLEIEPFPENFWLMTSVTGSANFIRAIELLRVEGGSRKGISYEPALGPLPMRGLAHKFDWVIAGGESGKGAVPSDPQWYRDVRSACLNDAVPFFFKQWGGANKGATGRILDGQEFLEMPRWEARAAA